MQPPVLVSILKNLKCGHCRKYVTCGPVHVTPDSSILCGRCIRFAKKSYRNTPFETIASLYHYPCHYWPKHCNKKLVWNEALDHERKCLFQSSCNVFCSRPGTFFKSDRKFPNNSELRLEHVPDNMLGNLKCLACESYLSNAPVYIVTDGRSICHRCIVSNGIPREAIRNLAYETLASSVIFPCIFHLRGCTLRLQFGNEMWKHENECSYGQVSRKLSKKPSTQISRDGKEKERGVIETHSGHIWGTITPHSALFAPPKTKNNDGKMVTQELTEVMKKKNEESKNFDAQSVDSIMSKASTFDSLADNISRSTGDNISRDNISRSTVDNISRDNISRSSSRMLQQKDYRPSNEPMLVETQVKSLSQYSEEVIPLPTPPGYNRIEYNGHYYDNVSRHSTSFQQDPYRNLYHYPPIHYENFPNYVTTHSTQFPPTRSESLRVGNQELINELKVKQKKKHSSTKYDNPNGHGKNSQETVDETQDKL